jgi:hypothetical protein
LASKQTSRLNFSTLGDLTGDPDPNQSVNNGQKGWNQPGNHDSKGSNHVNGRDKKKPCGDLTGKSKACPARAQCDVINPKRRPQTNQRTVEWKRAL